MRAPEPALPEGIREMLAIAKITTVWLGWASAGSNVWILQRRTVFPYFIEERDNTEQEWRTAIKRILEGP